MTSPFDWKNRPSVFTGDRNFIATRDGLSMSQASTRAIVRRTAKTGVNPGTIAGLTAKADQQRVIRKRAKR